MKGIWKVCSIGKREWRDGAQSYRRWREIQKKERYREKKRHWGGEREGGRAGGRGRAPSGAREKRREKFPGVFIS